MVSWLSSYLLRLGDSVVVVPSQMVLAPEMEATGFVVTSYHIAEGGDTQLVDVWVNVKVADPAELFR
jgi:hypothetical protein